MRSLQIDIAEYTIYFSAASAREKSSSEVSLWTFGNLALCMNCSSTFNVDPSSESFTCLASDLGAMLNGVWTWKSVAEVVEVRLMSPNSQVIARNQDYIDGEGTIND